MSLLFIFTSSCRAEDTTAEFSRLYQIIGTRVRDKTKPVTSCNHWNLKITERGNLISFPLTGVFVCVCVWSQYFLLRLNIFPSANSSSWSVLSILILQMITGNNRLRFAYQNISVKATSSLRLPQRVFFSLSSVQSPEPLLKHFTLWHFFRGLSWIEGRKSLWSSDAV